MPTPDRAEPEIQSPVEAPVRNPDLTATTYGDAGFTTKPRGAALSSDVEDQFPRVELYDSAGDPPPPGDGPKPPEETPEAPPPINDTTRDPDSRKITSQKNPWGRQDVTYSKDYPDQIMTLNTEGSDGKRSYQRQPDGSYTDDQGNKYKNISIDQNSGDITFNRADGTKNIQNGNGNSAEFDKDGRPTFKLDRAGNRTTEYAYDGKDGQPTTTVTDLRTGKKDITYPTRGITDEPGP